MLYQLSYSRRWRSIVFQAIAPQAYFQGFTLDVIYVCVCVCVRAIASQRKGIPESTTRVCVVPGLRFTGGGAANKKNARHLFGPFLPKGGISAKRRTTKTNTRRLYPGHCFGAGGGENRNPRSICQGIGGAGRGSLEYLHQQRKQRVYDCRARLF